jgi:putative zinc finger/helix-turn-helix YgiT family protein
MKSIIPCAFCDGEAKLRSQKRVLTYRKEEFNVVEHYYQCEKCHEEFTTTEIDTVTILQAHNQYREKYLIPFTDWIISLRSKYELSAAKMSEVLGLGANGYSNYEKGEMPSPAIANLIKAADNPEFFIGLLIKAKDYFSENSYNNALDRVLYLLSREFLDHEEYSVLNSHKDPVALTGFKSLNIDKIANILVAFISRCNSNFNDKLKLNKLMFYSDFVNYRATGYSITGITYRAIQYGPVPTYYSNIYGYLADGCIIDSEWIKDLDGSAKETFVSKIAFDESLFSESELSTIDQVVNKFKDTSTWDLVDIVHNERAWIELHANKSTINYQDYAFDIKAI